MQLNSFAQCYICVHSGWFFTTQKTTSLQIFLVLISYLSYSFTHISYSIHNSRPIFQIFVESQSLFPLFRCRYALRAKNLVIFRNVDSGKARTQDGLPCAISLDPPEEPSRKGSKYCGFLYKYFSCMEMIYLVLFFCVLISARFFHV